MEDLVLKPPGQPLVTMLWLKCAEIAKNENQYSSLLDFPTLPKKKHTYFPGDIFFFIQICHCFFLGHLNRSRQIRNFSTWIGFFLHSRKTLWRPKTHMLFWEQKSYPSKKKCFESWQLVRSLVYFGFLHVLFFFPVVCFVFQKKRRNVVLFITKFKAKLASIRWMNDHLGIICGVRCHHLAVCFRQEF